MPSKRHFRTAALALVSGAALIIAVYAVGIDTIATALSGINLNAAALAGGLVLLNAAFALLRFRSVLKTFGYHPTWRQTIFAFTIGQVSNQILFNVIGQSVSRAAALKSAGVPFSVSVMATYWERLIAAGLLFVLSIGSALFLFINIRLDLQSGGAYLISLAGGIALVSLVVSVFLARSKEIDLNLAQAPRFLLQLWPSTALTLAAHVAMLGAYLAILHGLQIRELGGNIAAALTIVMFAASLPISFSGWGIRELSAAQALGVVGVDPEIAVAGAITVGLLGFAVTILCAGIGLYLYVQRKPHLAAQPSGDDKPEVARKWTQIASLGSAILSAVLLFFQIRLPLQHGEITANAADIMALTGLGLTVFFLWSRRSFGPLPMWFIAGLAAISLLFLLSLGLGYLRFGSNSWAVFNRGLGWLIILGYVALGMAAALGISANRSRLVFQVFGIAGATLAIQQLLLLILSLFGPILPSDAFIVPLRGYANNSNAFAFQMIMAAACLATAGYGETVGREHRIYGTLFALTALAIYYSHSRSGLGMLLILLIAVVTFSSADQRPKFIKLSATTALAIAVAFFLPTATNVELLNSTYAPYLSLTMERTSSDNERWLSIIEGWNLWLKHPLFGAGLGGYVQERLVAGREFLVIHSIPIWLMAEMGLLGLFVVGFVLALLINGAFQLLAKPASQSWGLGLLIILACMTASGLVHDLFFQRSFWFLLGLYVAAGFTIAKEDTQPRRSAN